MTDRRGAGPASTGAGPAIVVLVVVVVVVGVVAAAALVFGLGSGTSTNETTRESEAAQGVTPTPDHLAAARALTVTDPAADLPAYRRQAFGDGWDYDPASGCNTRERVLVEEAVVPPRVDDRCRSTEGRWRSLYDGHTVTDVAELQIDHLVPLADAWRSGAAGWTDERRRAFANDLTNPATLIAVTSAANGSKSDSTPDHWLPPDRSAWCPYAASWVEVKIVWKLSVTAAEKTALVEVLTAC